jgi:hypothetical protein
MIVVLSALFSYHAIRELLGVAHRPVDITLTEGVEDAFRWGLG